MIHRAVIFILTTSVFPSNRWEFTYRQPCTCIHISTNCSTLWDFRFSRWQVWRWLFSKMLCDTSFRRDTLPPSSALKSTRRYYPEDQHRYEKVAEQLSGKVAGYKLDDLRFDSRQGQNILFAITSRLTLGQNILFAITSRLTLGQSHLLTGLPNWWIKRQELIFPSIPHIRLHGTAHGVWTTLYTSITMKRA
jgi:hypothetical protein